MNSVGPEWLPVCEKLGEEKTMKLIQNGTTLKVAMKMIEVMEQTKQTKLKLNYEQ